MKAIEQYFHLVPLTTLFVSILSVDITYSVTIQMRAIEPYFHMLLFIIRLTTSTTFGDHSECFFSCFFFLVFFFIQTG